MGKILVVSEVFYPENFLINDLVKEWKLHGHQVDVLTQHPSYPYGKTYDGYENVPYSTEEWEGSTIHRFKLVEGYKDSRIKKVLNYLCFVYKGSRIAAKIGKDYDTIFVSQTGPLTVALPAITIKRKYNKPISIWTFDLWPDVVYEYGIPNNRFTNFFINRFIKYVYGKSDNIFVSSEGFIDHLKSYNPGKTVTYVPNWHIGTEDRSGDIKLDRSKYNFTFTGNISVWQNIENVVRGFSKAGITDAVLNIVGDGSAFNSVKNLVESENIAGVKLWGSRPYYEIADVLSQSDALVLSLVDNDAVAKTEPLKLQSYLKAGKPIYCVTRGEVSRIVCNNNIGLSSDPSNVDSISDGFKQMREIFNKEKGQYISEAAADIIKRRFDKQMLISRLNETLFGSDADRY